MTELMRRSGLLALASVVALVGCEGSTQVNGMNPGEEPGEGPGPGEEMGMVGVDDREMGQGAEMGSNPVIPVRPGPPPGPAPGERKPNLLDQQALFTCDASVKAATPARLWRISASQFGRAASSVAESDRHPIENALAGSRTTWRFTNPADEFTVEEPNLDALFRSGRTAVGHTLRDNKIAACIREAWRDDMMPSADCQRAGIQRERLGLGYAGVYRAARDAQAARHHLPPALQPARQEPAW
jgi:hypothetical protein